MAQLEVPVVSVVVGEGASGGAIGIGMGDRLLMLENAWYSVIAPESCSSILWRSWDYKEEAARALKLTAPDLVDVGVVDEIVPEPTGGAHRRPEAAYEATGRAVVEALAALEDRSPAELVAQRLEKYDGMGVFEDASAARRNGAAAETVTEMSDTVEG